MNSKSQSGFSLVELMIAVSILSVILYGTMSVFKNQMHNLKVYENKLSKLQLEKDLDLLLRDTVSCNMALSFPITFSDPTNSVFNNFEIKDKYGATLLTYDVSSSKNTYDHLKMESIVLTNPNNILPNGSGIAQLIVFMKAENHNLSLAPIEIPVGVSLDASGKVNACSSGGLGGSWASMPPGSHCGIFMQTQGSVKAQSDCDGHNPASSCPTGFTRADLGYFEAGGGARKLATCVKN